MFSKACIVTIISIVLNLVVWRIFRYIYWQLDVFSHQSTRKGAVSSLKSILIEHDEETSDHHYARRFSELIDEIRQFKREKVSSDQNQQLLKHKSFDSSAPAEYFSAHNAKGSVIIVVLV